MGFCPLIEAVLTPLIFAIAAFRLMNTDYLTAPGAGPLLFFIVNKVSYPTFSYSPEIVDHAHAILSSIALIQMVQPGAGKAFTTEAVFEFGNHHLLTVLNAAHRAGLRFGTVVTSAAGTHVFVTNICVTETTVHSAGGD